MNKKNDKRRNFSFSSLAFIDIEQQLKNLNSKKVSQDTDISAKILKVKSDFFAQFVLKNYDEVITISTFPNIVKHAIVRPVYKKNSSNEVQNYHPVSILSNCLKCMASACLMK